MHDEISRPRLRAATVADADALAALHMKSWRSAYRGSMSDTYLDGPIEAERQAFWRERYRQPRAGLWTVIAEDRPGNMLGFLCALLDHDQTWGTLIDNLHVDPNTKGRGIGRLMMRAAAEHLLYALPRRPVYLFVLRDNKPAQAFYDRLGGEPVEAMMKTEPDGSALAVIRYVWPSVAAFIDGVS
jgi:ribosomal protein S18 acetylase RimI-like enzyme